MIVVQASFFWVEKDVVLLERTESAKVGQFSYIPTEGGAVCRLSLSKLQISFL